MAEASAPRQILASAMAGASVRVASVTWAAWVVLELLSWLFVVETPTLLLALEFGIANIVLTAAHELGHVCAALAQGRRIKEVSFKPFHGAHVVSSGADNGELSGWLALAGPMAGTAAAVLMLGAYAVAGHASLLVTGIAGLLYELLYLNPKRVPESKAQLAGHDGQEVAFWRSDRGSLSARARRRLSIGWWCTIATQLLGVLAGGVLSGLLWITGGEQVAALLSYWLYGF